MTTITGGGTTATAVSSDSFDRNGTTTLKDARKIYEQYSEEEKLYQEIQRIDNERFPMANCDVSKVDDILRLESLSSTTASDAIKSSEATVTATTTTSTSITGSYDVNHNNNNNITGDAGHKKAHSLGVGTPIIDSAQSSPSSTSCVNTNITSITSITPEVIVSNESGSIIDSQQVKNMVFEAVTKESLSNINATTGSSSYTTATETITTDDNNNNDNIVVSDSDVTRKVSQKNNNQTHNKNLK